MRRIHTVFVAVLLLCLLITGFMLPKVLSDFSDARTLDQVQVVEAQTVHITQQHLHVLEKLAFVRSREGRQMALETGKYMDPVRAVQAAQAFLERLVALGIAWEDPSAFYESHEPEVILLMDTSGGTSMILWNVTLEDAMGNALYLLLDDETGLVLGGTAYFAAWGKGMDSEWDAAQKEPATPAAVAAELLGSYYGCAAQVETTDKNGAWCTVLLTEGTYSAQVRLEVMDGSVILS